ncbi:MAG: sensor histidine kinase [Thermoguttaceae bacterium]
MRISSRCRDRRGNALDGRSAALKRMFRVFQSLGFRLLAPLFLAVGGVLACYAAVSFRSTEDHFLHLVWGDLERTSGMIKRATHDAMLANHKDDVQATITRLAETPDITAIRIYDKTGRIVMSAHSEEIGQRIAADTETCRACHQDDRTSKAAILQPGKRAHEELRSDVLRHLSAIETEPGCVASGCHAHTADQKVLGVLDLEMSTAPMAAALGTAKGHFLWATAILTFVILAVVAVFIRRGLQMPISRLCAGTRRIAQGDLETRVKVSGHGELTELAGALNRMAEDLGAARREVNQWSQNLERKVAEKTAELQQAQRQVLHMEKMASLGKLSATVAHEINNPLSGMLIYAGLSRRELQEQALDPVVREEVMRYLSVIEHECRRCGGIVQNLLLFAKRSGSNMALVDVNDVLRQSLMLVEHHLHMNGLKLRAEFLEADSQITADGGQLQQALVALLVNAVEAMSGLPEGRGELVVSLHGEADSIRIDIGDNGIGIASDVLPQIFEPFYSTKEAENGVGLGLSVVYGIVQRHGGRIDVDSKVGSGTTFHLTLLRQPEPAEK